MTLDEETAVFERFHALRKYNSSRRERQIAWAEVERILSKRRIQSMRAHPIAPAHRWWDFNNTAPAGWTYPSRRTLEPDEIDALFPGALAAFATQCDDIRHARFVFHQWNGAGRLRVSVPRIGGENKNTNITWMPEMGIWRRYSTHVQSKPYREIP